MKTFVRSPFSTLGFLVAVATVVLAVSPTARAQNITWTGTSNGSWNVGTNWSTGAIPGSGNATLFDGTGSNLNTTTNAPFTVQSLTFTANQTSVVTINATTTNYLRVTSLSPIVINAGNHVITGNGTGTSGNFWDFGLEGSAASGTRTISIAGNASLDIQGRVANTNGTAQVARNVTKSGTGTLILSGQNGGAGGWQVSTFGVTQGVVRLANSGTFGNSGNSFQVSSGAAIELAGGFAQTLNTGGGEVRLNGTGISSTGALRSLSGNNTLSGTSTVGVALAANSSIGVDADRLLLNVPITMVSGTRSLTKVGAGTLTLNGTNTYNGTTTISAGTLQIGNGGASGSLATSSITNNGSLIYNRSDSFSVGYAIGGNGTVTKLGAGTLTLNGTNTYTGATTISQGTLALGASGSLASSLIDVQAGATFNPSAVSGGFSLASGQILSIAETGTVLGNLNVANGTTFFVGSGSGVKTIAGNLSFGGNSTWNVSNVIAGGAGITNDSSLYSITFGSGFGVANLAGVDGNTPLGTYTLISSNQTFSSSGIGNWGAGAQASIGNGKFAYFQQGSLQLVVVPEPSTVALATVGLAGLGYLAHRRRRR